MKRRLGVAGDMRDNAFEYLGLVGRRRTHVCIQVLQLDLLSPEVVAEAPKGTRLVLFAILAGEGVFLNPLPHRGRVLLKSTAHVKSKTKTERIQMGAVIMICWDVSSSGLEDQKERLLLITKSP